jgi:hypothetical protein
LLGLGQADFVAHQTHQVFGIAAVVDGERFVQADAAGEVAQQARADAVEGAGPGQAGGRLAAAHAQHPVQHVAGAVGHLGGGAPRKRQQQDALRIGAAGDQARHPVRQRIGLARAGAGDHQQGPHRRRRGADVVFDGGALLGIEAGEGVFRGDRSGGGGHEAIFVQERLQLYIYPV